MLRMFAEDGCKTAVLILSPVQAVSKLQDLRRFSLLGQIYIKESITTKTTQEYFNMAKKELREVRNEYGCTKEECLLLDESINTQFYSDNESSLNGCGWLRSQGYSIYARLKMTDGRIAVLAV